MATLKRTDELMRQAALTAAQGIQLGTGRKKANEVQNAFKAPQTSTQTTQKPMGEQRSGYSYSGARPSYSSPYSSQIDDLLDSILNREDFSYDVDSDPLYQQYRAQYVREGDRAMRDTMGQAAALTGGYGSSYASTAGTQANDYYMSQLNDRVPELYQLAYQKYQNDVNDRYNQLSAFQGAENQAYGQYRDSMGDYQTDRAFDYGLWGDAQAQENWQSQSEYQKAQDALAQQNWQTSLDYQKEQDALAQGNWQKEFEYQKQQDALAYALKKASANSRSSGGGFDWGDAGTAGSKQVPNDTADGRDNPEKNSAAYYQIDNRLRQMQQMEGASKSDMAREMAHILDVYEQNGYEFDKKDIDRYARQYGIEDEINRMV